MKSKFRKVMALLTLMVMVITLLVPMSVYATNTVNNPDGTFNEADANDGTFKEPVTVNVRGLYTGYSVDSGDTIPQGLQLRVEADAGIFSSNINVYLDGVAANHKNGDSVSFRMTFNYSLLRSTTKTFNIQFRDPAPGQNNPGGPGGPGGPGSAPTVPENPTVPEVPEVPAGEEQPEILTRNKIRVLEVYPSKINLPTNYKYYQDYKDYTNKEYRNIFEKWGNNAAFEVTSISLNRFIALKEDVNGKYDIVYFGKGRYFRNAVDENRYGNDITALAANKVKEFIESGQLCIFHADAFRIDKVDSQDGKQSKMYEQLYSYRNRNNVIVVNNDTELKDVVDHLNDLNYIKTNYGKTVNNGPVLKILQQPKTYDDENSKLDSNKLTYKFKVYDPETPLDEKLKVTLYVDRNNDGLFDEKEIVRYAGASETGYTTEVLNGRSATIEFNMPQGLTGIFFWKLEVRDAKNAADEKVDVFKLVNGEIVVKVLQVVPHISPSYGNLHLNTIDGDYIDGRPIGDQTGGNKIQRNQKFKQYSRKAGEYRIDVEEMTTKEFKQAAENGTLQLNGKYDMIILGFNDNYSNSTLPFSDELVAEEILAPKPGQTPSKAIQLLRDFINTKQSVMFTHDSIHFHHNLDLTYNFVDDVGQMIILDPNGTTFETKDKGAWTPGTISGGLNITTPMTNEYNSYLKDDYDLSVYRTNNPNNTAKLVTPVNRNAIMLYPFNLENVPANQREVSGTHYQWRKLNLETPPEGDEEVIPLLNLYNASSGRVTDDAMNNYYTYTKGSITYSGTGHSGEYPDYEIKLFVNTAIKAYSIANHAPEITIFEPTDNSMISQDKASFNLKFTADDFDYDDENLQYRVEVDYDNTSNDPFVIVKDWTNMKRLEEQVVSIPNSKTNLGEFKVRVTVRDDENAQSSKTITLKKVDEPLIDPAVEVYKGGTRITKALVGETVRAKLIYTITGKASPSKTTTPSYTLAGNYSVRIDELDYVENRNYVSATSMEQVTFTSSGPSKSEIVKEHDVTIDTGLGGSPKLRLQTDVIYNVGGGNVTKAAWETLDIRKGQVKIIVKDQGGSPVEGVVVRDAATNAIVGQTNTDGELIISGVYGEKDYKIDDSAAFTSSDEAIYRSNDSWNKGSTVGQINLTYDNYRYIKEFTVINSLDVTIDYYRLNADRNALTPICSANDTETILTHKNSTVTIVAKVQVESLAAGELREMNFVVNTKKNGVDITSGKMMAVIKDDPAGLESVIPSLSGLTQLKKDNLLGSGSYAGNTYYLVIEVESADEQQFGISAVNMKTFSPSGTPHDLSNSYTGVIKFRTTTLPLLR